MLKHIIGVVLGVVLAAAAGLPVPDSWAAERVWRIGWFDLSPTPASPDGSPSVQAFRAGLSELGHIEGRDYVIDARFADADFTHLPRLARELVDARVDIIVTVGTPTTVAAKEATSTIPIIMTGGENPVRRRLIASFAHPGGNVTGLTHQPSAEFWQKGLQLLKQTVPGSNRVAVFVGDEGISRPSDAIGLDLVTYDVHSVRDLDDLHAIFSKTRNDHADALFIFPEFIVGKYQNEIGNFMISDHLPAMTQYKPLIEHDALLYYYTDFIELRRHAATYVDKIMKGAKPADLPVEQPSKFEFIVNLKTARALGVTVPTSILAFADRIIE